MKHWLYISIGILAMGAGLRAASIEDRSMAEQPETGAIWFARALPTPAKNLERSQPTPGGPVVLVVVDALNASHLGLYGYFRATSPNLDALSTRGRSFTNWISNSSWTRPSYTTLVTGEPSSRHRMELGDERLHRRFVTLARMFQQAGYRTGGFVGNPLVNAEFGYGRGYDVYEDERHHGAFPKGSVLVDRAIQFLDGIEDRPWFLHLFLTDTHAPYDPPEPYRGYLTDGGFQNHILSPRKEYPSGLSPVDRQGIQAAYDGEVAFADAQIGRLLEHISHRPDAAQTTVVITADHGEMLGAHDCFQHAYHMWQETLRVPMIIVSPGQKERGVTDSSPFTHLDLLPTLAFLTGLESLPGKRGRSVFSHREQESTRPILSTYNAKGVFRNAVHLGRFKLVYHRKVDQTTFSRLDGVTDDIAEHYPSLSINGPRFELYDLVADPNETQNLYDQLCTTPQVRQMRRLAMERHEPAARPVSAISDETLEALRAAGYIQ